MTLCKARKCCCRTQVTKGHTELGKVFSLLSWRWEFDSCPVRPAGNEMVWAWEALEMPSDFPWRRKLYRLQDGLFKDHLFFSLHLCLSTTTPSTAFLVMSELSDGGKWREAEVTWFCVYDYVQFLRGSWANPSPVSFFVFVFIWTWTAYAQGGMRSP